MPRLIQNCLKGVRREKREGEREGGGGEEEREERG